MDKDYGVGGGYEEEQEKKMYLFVHTHTHTHVRIRTYVTIPTQRTLKHSTQTPHQPWSSNEIRRVDTADFWCDCREQLQAASWIPWGGLLISWWPGLRATGMRAEYWMVVILSVFFFFHFNLFLDSFSVFFLRYFSSFTLTYECASVVIKFILSLNNTLSFKSSHGELQSTKIPKTYRQTDRPGIFSDDLQLHTPLGIMTSSHVEGHRIFHRRPKEVVFLAVATTFPIFET